MKIVFLYKSPQNEPIVRRLAEKMVELGADATHLHERSAGILADQDDIVIVRWDSAMPVQGTVALNDPDPVALSRDKIRSRLVLAELAPETWTSYSGQPLPVILRPRRHSGGRHFHIVDTFALLAQLMRKYRVKGWYASPIINKKEEYRVFVVCGRVAAVSQHFPPAEVPDQIMWNVTAGGRMKNVRWDLWNLDAIRAAVAAAERLGLDVSAIDVGTDQDSKAYVFEANTAPGITNRYTKECVAKALIYSCQTRTTPGVGDTWKAFIHPAIRSFED